MSIWSSRFTRPNTDDSDAPYLDFVDKGGAGLYTSDAVDSRATTERGGFVDVATSGLCGLVRVTVDDGEGESVVWLDRDQVSDLLASLEDLRDRSTE